VIIYVNEVTHKFTHVATCNFTLGKLAISDYLGMEHNNSYNWHLYFIPSSPVLQSQKLGIERLFLHFCSIRTNEYELNQSATYINYCVPFLRHCFPVLQRYTDNSFDETLTHNINRRWRYTDTILNWIKYCVPLFHFEVHSWGGDEDSQHLHH